MIASNILRGFWSRQPWAETPLRAWYAEASRAKWPGRAAVQATHRGASMLGNGRVLFDIGGTGCCILAAVHYKRETLFIRFVGTRSQCERANPATI